MSHPELIVPGQSVPDGVLAILARYAQIVDAPQAFLAAAQKPLPVCWWHNLLKGNAAWLSQYLADLGVNFEPIGWMPGAFKAERWPSPGNTLAFSAGWYYVQEEIAMAAVAALEPQPGECILDLCAAPGGKTAQIAVRLQERGAVYANEMHAARLPSLSVTVSRMGFTQVLTTQADGRSLPCLPHQFDRVLVDAPCSGEGNLRRRQQPRPWQPQHGLRMAAAQQKLLSRALDLVKPGGTVVYSTCTFAPEENEAVLNAVMGDRAFVEPFEIPGLYGQTGLSHWQGNSFRVDIGHARRYFPHFNDTGGFFVAKLRRTEADLCLASPKADSSLSQLAKTDGQFIQTLRERFGIVPELLNDYRCWATGKRRLWLLRADVPWVTGVEPQTLGIPLATHTKLGLKPSTAFLQRFGPHIERNVIQLPDEQAAFRFLRGETQPLAGAIAPGYVHVRFQSFDLGCGRYSRGNLESQIPKTLRWRKTDCSA